MANTFKNAAAENVGTTPVDVYTTPASTTTVIHAAWITNNLTTAVEVTVTWYDSSGTKTINLVVGGAIPAGDSLILDKPLNLETGDKFTVSCETANGVDVTLALLEIT